MTDLDLGKVEPETEIESRIDPGREQLELPLLTVNLEFAAWPLVERLDDPKRVRLASEPAKVDVLDVAELSRSRHLGLGLGLCGKGGHLVQRHPRKKVVHVGSVERVHDLVWLAPLVSRSRRRPVRRRARRRSDRRRARSSWEGRQRFSQTRSERPERAREVISLWWSQRGREQVGCGRAPE